MNSDVPASDGRVHGGEEVEDILRKRGTLQNSQCSGTGPEVSCSSHSTGDTSTARKIPTGPTRP